MHDDALHDVALHDMSTDDPDLAWMTKARSLLSFGSYRLGLALHGMDSEETLGTVQESACNHAIYLFCFGPSMA